MKCPDVTGASHRDSSLSAEILAQFRVRRIKYNGRPWRTVTLFYDDGASEKSRPMECHLISVVDDDESVRESLPDSIRGIGLSARAFSVSRRVRPKLQGSSMNTSMRTGLSATLCHELNAYHEHKVVRNSLVKIGATSH